MMISRNLLAFALLALLVSALAFNTRAQVEQEQPAAVQESATNTNSDGQDQTADAAPADLLDNADKRAGLGVTFGIDQYGVFCKFVYPGSPAAKAGLRPGIRILSVNETECRSIEVTVNAIRAMKPGDEVTMRIVHDGDFKTCTATLSSWDVAFGAVLQQDDNLANRVAQLEGKHASLSDTVDKFGATTERVTKAEANVASLQKQSESAQTNIESLVKNGETSQKAIEALQKSAESTVKSVESLQKSAESSVKSVESLQKSAESSVKSVESLQKSTESSAKNIETSQKSIESLQKTVDSLGTLAALVKKADEKIASLEKNVDTLTKEREAMTTQIGALQAEIAKLKTAAPPDAPKKEPAPPDAATEPKTDKAASSESKQE